MTTQYSNGQYFKSSRFMVFANRIIALLVCLPLLWWESRRSGAKPHNLPLYKYSFCSVSNIASSVCQYEALKFVSFPTQAVPTRGGWLRVVHDPPTHASLPALSSVLYVLINSIGCAAEE